MPSDDILLNEQQAIAVAHDEGPALILAGAGSGKTRVITTRAVRLISSGVSPQSIFCVTFTNKAAGEMRSRISALLGIAAEELWIATFHSACLRIIKSEYLNLGYETMPVIFDATDQKSLVKSIIKEMGIADSELPHRQALSIISRYKNDMKGPEDLASDSRNPKMKEFAEVFSRYQRALKKNNALDFDDLMLSVIALFRKSKEALDKYREKFSHIMVDEFQDTNLVQYSLIKLLSGEKKNVFVVGDDDQSIYRWRGARIGNILGFEKDFPNCKVIKLEENYRSSGNILLGAGKMVENVYGRKEKTLWTKKDSGEPITIYSAGDETDEAMFIVNEIKDSVQKGNSVYGDYSVFYRTNAQSRVLEECLNRSAVPYRIYGGLKFYARKEIKDVLAYFRLAVNENDEVSFLRAVSAPSRGAGPASLSKLKKCATEKGISLLAACGAEDNGLAGAVKAKMKDFHSLIIDARMSAMETPARELIETVLERSGFVNSLLDKRTAQDNARVENLKELAGAPHKEELIVDFLDRVSLQSDADLVEDSVDYVSLMTLHVSKGLEFPTVFMVGMEENLFPHFNSMESIDELDEERRLCYVGMTRAMKKLFLTHAVSRRLYGQVSSNSPSPFLKDIPKEIVLEKYARRTASPLFAASRPSPKRAKDLPEIDVNADLTDGFAVGKRVQHRIFGNGVVKKCEGVGDELKLTILFRHAGMKKLNRRFVELVA